MNISTPGAAERTRGSIRLRIGPREHLLALCGDIWPSIDDNDFESFEESINQLGGWPGAFITSDSEAGDE